MKTINKQTLIDFVNNNDFAFCFNAGREVCNTGINNYDECVEGIVSAIKSASNVTEADEAIKAEFAEDNECTIYQAGDVAIAYYE